MLESCQFKHYWKTQEYGADVFEHMFSSVLDKLTHTKRLDCKAERKHVHCRIQLEALIQGKNAQNLTPTSSPPAA